MNHGRIPSRIDLMWPTLQALVKSGGSASNREISEALAEIMAIPDEILEIPHGEGPQSEIDYRAAWARTRLKRIGAVVNSERGIWSITDRGRRFDSEEQLKEQTEEGAQEASAIDDPAVVAEERETCSIETYSVTDVVNEGCFLGRREIERLLERLRTRKNLILQGPPGTGKTWLAKRLAFALIGERDERKVRAAQFHPNLSYPGRDAAQRPSLPDLRLSPLPGRPWRSDRGSSRGPAPASVRRRERRRNGGDPRTSHPVRDGGSGGIERDDSPATPERGRTDDHVLTCSFRPEIRRPAKDVRRLPRFGEQVRASVSSSESGDRR